MTQSNSANTPVPQHRVETTVYLDVVPKFGRVYKKAIQTWEHGVEKITVKGVTQSRPAQPKGVVVKMTLRFNEQAFMPLEPSAVIDIPDSLVAVQHDIEVEATDANGAAVAEYLASQARNA